MNKIKVCIIGVGNCAASLVMGLSYYNNMGIKENVYGLMHEEIGGYRPYNIEVVASFDVDRRKVGKDLSDAIFSQPNNTKKFSDVPFQNVKVMKGPILDGVSDSMQQWFQVDENQKELSKDEIFSVLEDTNTEIIINYTPVGSQKLTEFWANVALESKCALVNAIPVFISSNGYWAEKFEQANIPIIGDDVKSMVGSTIVNRTLVQMIEDRGGKIDNSWQLNVGGNTDFRNMIDISRLESKKISKTESVKSLIPEKDRENTYVYAGPNGVIDCLNDHKISYMRIDFRIFGNINCSIDLKLSVEDSPNSAGIVIDAIRVAKLALDRKIGGPLIGPSAWMMKHPPIQYKDDIAYQMVEEFINQNSKN